MLLHYEYHGRTIYSCVDPSQTSEAHMTVQVSKPRALTDSHACGGLRTAMWACMHAHMKVALPERAAVNRCMDLSGLHACYQQPAEAICFRPHAKLSSFAESC
jgi:hypothetical protein